MMARIAYTFGVFLLLGGLIASELGLHHLTKRIPIVPHSYRGWDEPAYYALSREDSNAAHNLLLFLKSTGVVCMVGFTLIHLHTRKRMIPPQGEPDSVKVQIQSIPSNRPGAGASEHD